MRFIIASSFVPFIYGGGTFIVDWLHSKLVEAGHEVETIFLPFVEHQDAMFEQMLSYRLLDLTEAADCLIALRPPAYLLRHPNKKLWFIHHFRFFYDLWQTEYCHHKDNARNNEFRKRVMDADEVGFSESKHIYTNSQIVANRLQKFNAVEGEVLYPPVIKPEIFQCQDYQPTIVCVCRLEGHKRQELLVEAMRYTKSNAKLILAGKGSSDYLPNKLKMKVLDYGLKNKVEIRDRWISEQEKADLFNHCRAAAYLPYDEDSYGYPSLEAQHASKAVISTTDSGGVPELIEHRKNGLLVEPTPVALAAAIDELVEDRALAERLGQAGPARIAELDITWDRVIRKMAA